MTTNPFTTNDDYSETGELLAEGGTWLLDLVAAVDHLRRGYRPNLTVWDALDEALRWANDTDTAWDAADPLAASLKQFLETSRPSAAGGLQTAIRHWVTAMADRYNNAHHWPHPTPRRQFPPPLRWSAD